MFQYKCLNPISECGISLFDENYTTTDNLQDADGNTVTVTETTNGDYYFRDDNGTGFTDNGDGTWSDENGNSYTEMN